MRSLHQGRIGNRRISGGNVDSTATIAKLSSTNRGTAAIGRLSAITPTAGHQKHGG